MTRLLWTALAGISLVIGGCARVPPQAGFADVQALVRDRGVERVQWIRGSAEDEAAGQAIKSLLADELTADEAVQIALLNNRNLQATYEDLMIAQADLVEAGLLKNPVFSGEWRFREGSGDLVFEGSILQSFIGMLQIPMRKRIAAARFEEAKYRVAGEVLDLAGRTRSAFYRVQAGEQLLEMRRTVLDAMQAAAEVATRLRQAGNITELELAAQRAQYEQAKIDLADAEAAVLASRQRLGALMGLAHANWTIAARLPDPPEDDVPAESAEAQAVARSLDLGAQRQQVVAAARRLGLVKPFGLLPQGEAGISTGYEEGSGWAIGPALSLPIPLLDQGQPRLAFARSDLRRAEQLYRAREVEIRAEAQAAAIELRAARQRVKHYRTTLLPLRQQVLEQTQLQYNAMQVGVFQLLEAKQRQVETGAEYVRALRDYWLARARLGQITSGRVTFGERADDGSGESSMPRPERGGHR